MDPSRYFLSRSDIVYVQGKSVGILSVVASRGRKGMVIDIKTLLSRKGGGNVERKTFLFWYYLKLERK